MWFRTRSLRSRPSGRHRRPPGPNGDLTKTTGTVAKRTRSASPRQPAPQPRPRAVEGRREPRERPVDHPGRGLEVKRKAGPTRVFTAKQGPTSGSVILLAPKAGNRAGYEWAHSLDGGTTWTALPFTVQAKTTVTGLKPGSKWGSATRRDERRRRRLERAVTMIVGRGREAARGVSQLLDVARDLREAAKEVRWRISLPVA